MPSPVLFSHPSSVEHDTGPGHPERAARMPAIEAELAAHGWLGYERRESPAVERALLEAVHRPAVIDAVEALIAAGGGPIDADTVTSPGSWEAASRAAGGAAAMVDALLGEGARVGASLHRPPGHHAERARPMGFCLFNNVAVAAQHALDAHAAGRVMIVDWDVHHGNGTSDIFYERDDVLFVSLHEWPLYPGTGAASDTGSGAGLGHTVNLPVPPGTGDEAFISLLEHVVAPLGRDYCPSLLLISAGFDAHRDDPLADLEVTDAGYAAMAGTLRRLADDLGIPLGVVLEGGYDLGALARGVRITLETVAGAVGEAPQVALHPLAAAARERLGARWALET